MKARSVWRALPPGLAAALLLALPLGAQPWSFSITLAGIDQSSDGSAGSFRSQLNLDDGFLLEALELGYGGGEEGSREFNLKAWGFGGAEPAQGADLTWRFAEKWRFDLEYRRTESFFQLVESERGLRQDDWQISRWATELTWDGWKAARLSLGLTHVERSGTITQPFRELNALYLLGTDLDETRREATFRLETFSLPVKLVFEQSLARLERRNDWTAARSLNVDGEASPNPLLDADNARREDRDIPSSRLVATYGNDRLEVTGGLLWSPAELDVTGETSTTFGIDGGRLGQVQFADDLLGSATLDAFVAQLDVGVRLAPEWTLRLSGDRHDRAQDATLAGNRLLRLTNTLGDATEIPQAIDERTFFDVTDSDVRLEIEYRRDKWSAWAGYFDASRDVDYRFRSDQPDVGVDRTSDGALVGVAWQAGRRLKASVEYERGSFEQFVFRTDPETVDRTTFKLRTRLAKGWQLRLRGRFEAADNPPSQSSLDRSSDAFGAGAFWASEDGKHDFGFDLDRVELTSDTDLVFPGGGPGLSRYDLSLTTFGVHGRTEFGRARLTGSAQRVEDDGDTWPLAAWNARARLAFKTSEKTEVALFGQLWSYDEDLAQGDDFDVTRYGVAFAWRNK